MDGFPSAHSRPLAFKGLLDAGNGDLPARDPVLDRDSRGNACRLASDRTAHHRAGSGMGNLVAGNTAAGDKKVFNVQWHQDAVREMKIAPSGRKDKHSVAINELREDADRVLEARLA